VDATAGNPVYVSGDTSEGVPPHQRDDAEIDILNANDPAVTAAKK